MTYWVLPLLHWLQINEDDGYAAPGSTVWRSAAWAQRTYAEHLNDTVLVIVNLSAHTIHSIKPNGQAGNILLHGREHWAVDIVDY